MIYIEVISKIFFCVMNVMSSVNQMYLFLFLIDITNTEIASLLTVICKYQLNLLRYAGGNDRCTSMKT